MHRTKRKKSARVLLVEDDRGHARLITRAFDNYPEDFYVEVVGTLKAAKQYLSSSLPDLVITDIVLPDGRGTELLDQDKDESQFPMVVMTSYGDEQVAVDVMKSGALDYIVKLDSAFREMPRTARRVIREWEHVMRQRRDELVQSTLYKISEVANSDVSLEEFYRSIHENIGRLIDARNFFIALFDPETDLIHLPYFVDAFDNDDQPYKFGHGLTEQVLLTGKPLLINEMEQKKLVRQGKIKITGRPSKTWLGIPLKIGRRTFGALVVQHYVDARAYTEKDKEMLMFVSDQIAAVIDRKRADMALKESEKKYRMLFNSMMDAFAFHEAVYDEKGKFVDYRFLEINHMYEKIIGLKREEVIGKSVLEVSPHTGKQWIDIYGRVIQTGEPVQFEYYHEVSGKYYEVNAYRPEPDTFASVFSDITERKRAEQEKQELEEKLINMKKMEAIGRLAGGVAHDLNNVLSAIVSYPDLLLMRLPEDSTLRKPIITIQQSGQKAAAIVQDMLTLARRGVAVKEVVNLHDVLTNYLLSPEYEKLKNYHPDITIKTEIDEDLFNIEGSSIHLSKTLMNLISNAAEAMPRGGEIDISLSNRYLDNPLKGYDLSIGKGNYVTLKVADSGIGLTAEDMEKIFEPFYTKKEMGRSGTGLGMTVVWGTVKDHDGYINVISSASQGTSFELYFPITRKQVSHQKVNLPIEDYIGNGEKILFVDDDMEQREIATALLTTLGYTVDTVASGKDAVKYMETNSPDLVILDMVMDTGMDGLDTYKAIRRLNPHIRTIIASGYSETDRVKEAQRLGAGAYIKKPYTLENIGFAVKIELSK